MNMYTEPNIFFQNVTTKTLNYLTTDFPNFLPEEFSKFLLAKRENVVIVNYCFHKTYEVVGQTKRPIFLNSKDKLSKLLNQISMNALIDLWDEKQTLLYKWLKDSKKTKSYFELLNYRILFNMVQYYYKKINFPGTSSYLIYYNKVRVSYLLIFLDMEHLKKVFSNLELSKIIKETLKSIPTDESEFLLNYNPSLKEFILF